MLNCYRVLDLTDEKGFLCGKILGDLGADVIKIEKPGGDTSRRIGPFYQDIPDPERSLNWFAFNGSKRGITLNLEEPEGQEIFLKLCDTTDVLIETFKPGYLNSIGLGYDDLAKRNPRIIMSSITLFGQTGPFKDRESSDIGIMAMSGLASLGGYKDRAPLRMHSDQSYLLASAQAAAGTLAALHYRNGSDVGQHVDVSIYECAVRANFAEPFMWEATKTLTTRNGNTLNIAGIERRTVWACKDGYVTWVFTPEVPVGAKAFLNWLQENNQAEEWKDLDWKNTVWNQETIRRFEDTIAKFILTHTRDELLDASVEKGLFLAPINDAPALATGEQLVFRDYWKQLAHPELQTSIHYPGFSYLTSVGGNEIRNRAPLVGEHNDLIYEKNLGISKGKIAALKEHGVI
jgi:crotonobetainyl-CoA:carnitine CoA-transferase CaiB-like acyl-CoA transferase